MLVVDRRQVFGQAIIVAGCAYEIVAILSQRVPTITATVKVIGRSHPLGKLFLWSWCGYVAWHFLEPT